MFGHEYKNQFMLDESFININNGAFAATNVEIYQQSEKIRKKLFLNLTKLKVEVDEKVHESQKLLSPYIGTNPNNIAFTGSTTDSLNSVLRSIVFLAGDEVVVDANIYPSTMRILEFACGRSGARINQVHIPSGASDEVVLEKYELSMNSRTRLLLLEDTKTIDGLLNPTKKIVDLFKSQGVSILLDGTHSVGMKDINFDDLGVDWLVGSGHKYLLGLKGVGFIATAPHNHSMMRSMRISFSYEKSYPQRFNWVGTGDYTAWFTIGLGMQKIQEYGEKNVRKYCSDLVVEAAKMMASRFGVKYNISPTLSTFMTVIELPKSLQDKKISTEQLEKTFFNNGFIAKPVLIENVKYIRISAYIYNEISDYEKFCDMVDEILKGNLI